MNDVDLQFVFEPYVASDDGMSTSRGFGDLQFRLKINLWGNDGGATAFAFMPFITIPTGADGISSDHVEGGLIFPFAMDLTDCVGLGLMGETDFVYGEQDDGDDTVDERDMIMLHGVLGEVCVGDGSKACAADLNQDGAVGLDDFSFLLQAWGPCNSSSLSMPVIESRSRR